MTPDDALRSWPFAPGVVIALAVAALLHIQGNRRRRAGIKRTASFWAGLVVVALALLSPLDEASGAMLSAHMVQHLLLGLVAPLLLVASTPLPTMQRGLPASMGRGARVWRRWLHVRHLRWHLVPLMLLAVFAHVGSFWLWHMPRLYDAALDHQALHVLEHSTMFGGGVAFWAVAAQARRRRQSGIAVAALFLAALGSGALAALLTLAPRPLYSGHLTTTAPWHLSPLEDQQLAGALMWVPGGLVYAIAAAVLLVRWLDTQHVRDVAVAQIGCLVLVVAFAAVACGGSARVDRASTVSYGDAERGRDALAAYGCGACHSIPGVRGADALVGPPLDRFGSRSFIAGQLANTPDNLVRWILDPQGIEPGTAMPDLDVTEEDAQDMVAYLESR